MPADYLLANISSHWVWLNLVSSVEVVIIHCRHYCVSIDKHCVQLKVDVIQRLSELSKCCSFNNRWGNSYRQIIIIFQGCFEHRGRGMGMANTERAGEERRRGRGGLRRPWFPLCAAGGAKQWCEAKHSESHKHEHSPRKAPVAPAAMMWLPVMKNNHHVKLSWHQQSLTWRSVSISTAKIKAWCLVGWFISSPLWSRLIVLDNRGLLYILLWNKVLLYSIPLLENLPSGILIRVKYGNRKASKRAEVKGRRKANHS